MSASNETEQLSAFPAGHDPRPETLPSSNPPMTKAAMMQARRKSRGMSDAAPPMLRPDYVFPPPASVSVSVSAVNRTSPLVPHTSDSSSAHNTTSSFLSSLAPPSLTQKSQHLKTHYRTHSRNGSTVTVQDLKQAIAAAKTDLLSIAPVVVSTSDPSDAGSMKAASTLEPRDMPSMSISVAIATGGTGVEEKPLGELPGLPPLTSFSTTSTYLSRSGSPGKFDALKRHSSVDSFASSTSLAPLSTRPSSMILNRARDRTNVSVPPFFSYSIPHEFPSPYSSPRLKLPGAEPVSLPISPFARKRKHTYHHTTHKYPTDEIVVKLSGKDESTLHTHKLTVGDVPEVELIEHGFEHTSEEQEEQEQEQEEQEQEQEPTPKATTFAKDQDTHTKTEAEEPQDEGPKGDESMSEATQISESEAESVASLEPSLDAFMSTADKRMSWASMVSMDEDLNFLSKANPVAPASQPYRPPGSRLRAAASFTEPKPTLGANTLGGAQSRRKSFSENQRPARRPSPTNDESPSSSPTPPFPTPGRARKPAPTPLKLVGSNHSENHTQNKSAPSSPTTPTTSSRRRRSRSRKNQKDKEVEPQTQPSDNISEPAVDTVGETHVPEAAGEPKKTRTRSRSRSRSRSRNRVNAESNIPTEVPPVPQTPSWVPVHNMSVVSQSGPTIATLPVAPIPSVETPLSPTTAPALFSPSASTFVESDLKRRGPRPSRLLSTRSSHNLQLQTLNEDSRAATFSPRSAREAPSDYFSMRPLQPPRTPLTPGGDGDDDDYYYRLQMVTTPMIQNGFFPNWAKGDAQLEELERIRNFLSARQYPDEMPLSDEWTLFFSDTSRAKDKSQVQDAYSSAITPLFTCHTVPQFATSWKYVRERVRPATMKVNQNLHWFKKGIKP
ncbi:hypothetical protein BG000_002967, partial [Podila horticola]